MFHVKHLPMPHFPESNVSRETLLFSGQGSGSGGSGGDGGIVLSNNGLLIPQQKPNAERAEPGYDDQKYRNPNPRPFQL